MYFTLSYLSDWFVLDILITNRDLEAYQKFVCHENRDVSMSDMARKSVSNSLFNE